MWRKLLNAPWPDQGDLPELVRRQAAGRIRRYWTAQLMLLLLGVTILWISAEVQHADHAHAYVVPLLLDSLICVLGLLSGAPVTWLIGVVGAFTFQGMLIKGLGGITSVSLMLPYTFAAMLLSGRKRIFVQAVCVVMFWVCLIYEVLPLFPQLEPTRPIFVSYNILVATFTFQTLRFLSRLVVELNTAHVAQEVTQQSQQFLARVSHELRTPLNSVLGFAKMLRRTELPEPQVSYLKQVVEEGEQLNQLVSDLLDSAHLATGKLRLTLGACDVNTVCQAVGEEVRQVLKPTVSLEMALSSGLPEIQADELRLRQIVRNLAVNAAKYTLQGVIAIKTSQRGAHLLIMVSDTGPGIPEDQHEFVFVPFVKRDNRSAGVGLGLDIARQLARLHGGDIRLESVVGQGSTFTVELPLAGS
jgi:signal transduction histidine kinase